MCWPQQNPLTNREDPGKSKRPWETYLFCWFVFRVSGKSMGIIVWFLFFVCWSRPPRIQSSRIVDNNPKAFKRSVEKATNPPEALESSDWKNHVLPSGSLINTWKRIIGRRSFHFGANSAYFHGLKSRLDLLASGKVTTGIFPTVSCTLHPCFTMFFHPKKTNRFSLQVTGASSGMGRGTLAWSWWFRMEILTEIEQAVNGGFLKWWYKKKTWVFSY